MSSAVRGTSADAQALPPARVYQNYDILDAKTAEFVRYLQAPEALYNSLSKEQRQAAFNHICQYGDQYNELNQLGIVMTPHDFDLGPGILLAAKHNHPCVLNLLLLSLTFTRTDDVTLDLLQRAIDQSLGPQGQNCRDILQQAKNAFQV